MTTKILNLTGTMFLTIALLNLIGCKKASFNDQPIEPNFSASQNSVSISFDGDNGFVELTGTDISDKLIWSEGGVEVGDAYLDLYAVPGVTVVSNSGNVLTFEMENKEYTITTINSSSNSISFIVNGSNNRPVSITVEGGSESLSNYFAGFNVGDQLFGSGKTQWWPIVFAAAALVAGVVDAYCDNLIKNEVNACSAKGCKPYVGTCEVTCVCE